MGSGSSLSGGAVTRMVSDGRDMVDCVMDGRILLTNGWSVEVLYILVQQSQ